MCSINVCRLNSKLKYEVLQDHIKKFDIICLTETKCDSLIGYDIDGYKSYFIKKSLENINMVESMVYVSLLKMNLLIIVPL